MATAANSVYDLSMIAAGSVAAYRVVGLNGAQVSVKGGKVAGVAVYAAADGVAFAAACVGTAVVEAGAAIAIGDSLIADAQGRAIPVTGALRITTGATAVTSSTAAGPLTGSDLPEYVFADALEAAPAAGSLIEVLLRR